jgi:hypothetical protein
VWSVQNVESWLKSEKGLLSFRANRSIIAQGAVLIAEILVSYVRFGLSRKKKKQECAVKSCGRMNSMLIANWTEINFSLQRGSD